MNMHSAIGGSVALWAGSNSGQVTHTYWPSRSQWSSAGVPGSGCGWETAVSALITTTTVIS